MGELLWNVVELYQGNSSCKQMNYKDTSDPSEYQRCR